MKAQMILNDLLRLLADRRGASAVEYGLIVAIVIMAILASLSQMGLNLQKLT
ncbi:Flp family type IVb pilin [uncultured Sphingomonas sp.]|uniref:Flp family type IVb pilin n=1 Tax=uncultured Sphingomonas sp. TaxID=158754 RepID=UPI0025FA92C5|nr:Flp family type IVb pilin [uncultured Sphingomonas sp.]